MISKIEIRNYRMLRNIDTVLKPFNILVGPNASGKSTFLDAILLIKDILSVDKGVEDAIEARASSFQDLLWDKKNPKFRIALELEIPETIRTFSNYKFVPNCSKSRYEIEIGIDPKTEELRILEETLWLIPETENGDKPKKDLFPDFPESPTKKKRHSKSWKKVVTKIAESGNDSYFHEGTGYNVPFKLGPFRSALAGLPEDEERFPRTLWTKRKLKEGIRVLALNSYAMRKPCPPSKKKVFELDGSNLPIIIKSFEKSGDKKFNNWLNHLRTALPFLCNVQVKEREEDRFLYITVKDKNERNIPSWLLSDGSLRILALTLLAYLPDDASIYLIEEPENGVHPRAIEALYQSLSSVYSGQILVATHSPALLSCADIKEILCFSRKTNGEADIIAGDRHPSLRDWQGSPNISVLYAAGVLD